MRKVLLPLTFLLSGWGLGFNMGTRGAEARCEARVREHLAEDRAHILEDQAFLVDLTEELKRLAVSTSKLKERCPGSR